MEAASSFYAKLTFVQSEFDEAKLMKATTLQKEEVDNQLGCRQNMSIIIIVYCCVKFEMFWS